MQTQNKQILSHLKNGNSITSLEALKLFDCFRLSARIKDLRDMGFNILTERIRTNTNKTIGKYTLLAKVAT